MTKRHFIDLADAVRGMRMLDALERAHVASKLADVCARHNTRFDRDAFMNACGVSTD